ncbi:MAG: lysophospholipid acyltransferase family protein [Lentisphaerae bacterium]|nr:lysophospholipid acyltransferase family protein [Lentisphaerota bacterium]
MCLTRKLRFALEALLTRLGLALLPVLPRPAVLACARVAAAFAYYAAPQQRRITLANLEIAFGQDLSPRARRRIAREAFYTMALVILDLFWFSRRLEQRVRRYVTLDESVRLHVTAQPLIGVTAHFGNWELMSRALSLHGYTHVAAAMPLANPAVDAILGAGRSIPGVEIVGRQGAIRALLEALRQGKRVALLLDQNTKPDEGGLFVNFFGLPIPVSTAAAVLAERTGAPIVPVFCRANADGTYTIYSRPPLKPGSAGQTRSAIIGGLTQAIAALFEQEIRAQPGQWLWMYKRWKYIDPARPPENYPFYAKPLRLERNPIRRR